MIRGAAVLRRPRMTSPPCRPACWPVLTYSTDLPRTLEPKSPEVRSETVACRQRQDRVGGGGVPHEATPVRRGIALPVERRGGPRPVGVLVPSEPGEAARHGGVVTLQACLLQRQRDEPDAIEGAAGRRGLAGGSRRAARYGPACPGGRRSRPVPGASGRSACRADRRAGRESRTQWASGSGRTWNLKTGATRSVPPSAWNGVRLPDVVQIPRPFQPVSGSSIRPSSPLPKKLPSG